MKEKLILLFLLISLSKEGTKEEVIDLFKDYDGKVYSGYLNTLIDGNELFYIYTPSQNDPDNAPLLLWLNGGPGCSSLYGMLAEIGPVSTDNYSGVWKRNPYSWNTNANVVYIEQPAGVGFTKTSDPEYEWHDDVTAKNLLAGIKDFIVLFPELKDRPFYVSGESYAGVYIPFLAEAALEDESTDKINFKGALVGNGLTDFTTDNERSMVHFGFWRGIISIELYNGFERNCPHMDDEIHPNDLLPRNVTKKCNEIRQAIKESMEGNDIYGIYRLCPATSQIFKDKKYDVNRKHGIKKTILKNLKKYKKGGKLSKNDEFEDEEAPVWPSSCPDDISFDLFLNDPDTKTKLHVDQEKHWTQCSDLNYIMSESLSFWENTVPKYKDDVLFWFFSGTDDGVLPTLGTMRWIKKLKLDVETEWRQWKTDGQVSGYVQKYTSGLTLVTVKGAGHMVPQDRRKDSFTLINSFLNRQLPPE